MKSLQRSLVRRTIDRSKSTRWAQEAFSATSLDVVLHRIVENGVKAFRCPRGTVLLLDATSLNVAASVGIAQEDIEHTTIPIGESISGRVVKRGEPLLIQNASEYFARMTHNMEPYFQGSLLSTPLIFNKKIIGVIHFCRPTDQAPFTRDDLHHLITYAAQAAFAVASQQLVEQRTQELRQREEQLKASEQRYRLIANNVGDVIWTTDLDGNLSYISPSIASLIGYEIDETGTDAFMRKIVRESTKLMKDVLRERAKARDTDARELAARKMVTLGLKTRHKNGDDIWTETTISPMLDKDKKESGILGVTRDISERVRTEKKLRDLHSDLLTASHKAGMAEVATGILHNVGNVLNSINISVTCMGDAAKDFRSKSLGMMAELVAKNRENLPQFFSEDPQGQHLASYLSLLAKELAEKERFFINESRECAAHVDHVKSIIAMQQTYAKGSELKELVLVDEIVDSAISISDAALKKLDIKVGLNYEPLPPLVVNRHKIMQILINLINNARDALRESDVEPKVMTIRSFKKVNNVLCIVVEDNGIGIAPEIMPRIFVHGFTTKAHGHGFGLHSSANAAKEMNGHLSCQSDGVGNGTTFTLDLPFETS